MATTTTRLFLRTYRPIHSSSSSSFVKCLRHRSSRASLNNNGDNHSLASGNNNKGEKIIKPVVAVKAASMAAATNTATWGPPAAIREGLSNLLAALIARNNNNLQPQMMIERAIIDCRFFTLLAVAGSLLGSVLCFVEGCVLIVESYGHYFHTLAQRLDQNHLIHLLIEAIDMFLVGTALLVFGAGLYEMFVGSSRSANNNNNNNKKKGKEKDAATSMHSESNLLHLLYTKVKSDERGSNPRWVGKQSIEEAKSRIGHAVMMILQVGILEKLKDIPLLTGIDLACFAAAVLTSSASIFVLSKLYS